MIRVAILDDHPIVTNGLENALNSVQNIEVTHSFNSVEKFMQSIKLLNADVLILDMHLNDGNGYDVAVAMQKANSKTGIVVFSSSDNLYLVKKMQQAGCKGYLLKNANNNTLVKAIESVYSGSRYFSPEIERALMDDMFANKKEKNKKLTLTRREQEILQLIAKEYTTQEIANEIFLSVSAIEFHRTNLLQKLGAKNSVGLVKIALEIGLI
mgnify:FL=1